MSIKTQDTFVLSPQEVAEYKAKREAARQKVFDLLGTEFDKAKELTEKAVENAEGRDAVIGKKGSTLNAYISILAHAVKAGLDMYVVRSAFIDKVGGKTEAEEGKPLPAAVATVNTYKARFNMLCELLAQPARWQAALQANNFDPETTVDALNWSEQGAVIRADKQANKKPAALEVEKQKKTLDKLVTLAMKGRAAKAGTENKAPVVASAKCNPLDVAAALVKASASLLALIDAANAKALPAETEADAPAVTPVAAVV